MKHQNQPRGASERDRKAKQAFGEQSHPLDEYESDVLSGSLAQISTAC